MTTNDTQFEWYSSLKHEGLLIAIDKLAEYYGEDLDELPFYLEDELRRDIASVQEEGGNEAIRCLETVFEDVVGLDESGWRRASGVGEQWSRQLRSGYRLKPDWLWDSGEGTNLPVFIARPSSFPQIKTKNKKIDWTEKRLGIGRSKRVCTDVSRWMRNADQKLAVVTNGTELRLIFAERDIESWCQWDMDNWFQSGEAGPELVALRKLLSKDSLLPTEDTDRPKLLHAIKETRKGQSDLSNELGERVRTAVETLIRAIDRDKLDALHEDDRVDNEHVYIAACRMMMRLIVILFAEARDLLPRGNRVYNDAYSLGQLREQLEKRAGGDEKRLRSSRHAWPRILSLFQMMYQGSPHSEIPIPEYGGDLFAPGSSSLGEEQTDTEQKVADPVSIALSYFEDPSNDISDETVYEILNLISRTQTKIPGRRGNKTVTRPVNFSDLSTEYIGIIYEGLLDYELKRASEPMVFLTFGDEPVLPFRRLSEEMTEEQLKKLISETDGNKTDVTRTENDPDEGLDSSEIKGEWLSDLDENDLNADVYKSIFKWAKKVIKTIQGAPEEPDEEYERKLAQKARELVPPERVFLEGDWYLNRWGGTRKGSGTFYTPPQLVQPTVERTLEPLVTRDESDELKRPEEILELKVCDPAMGSGSFLISALRYLTDKLFESLDAHDRLRPERGTARLADGLELTGLHEESTPVPEEHSDFEERLRSRLKRYVVERCIYGVDNNPLATELARMSLWVETMDPDLPFEFLDHKLKVGNSLIGAWMDQVQDYPALGFERTSGGDSSHSNGVHFGKNRIEPALEEVRDELMNPLLRRVIDAQADGSFEFISDEWNLFDVHETIQEVFDELHEIPAHRTEERKRRYQKMVENNEHYRRIKQIFDTWCAIWFWPFDEVIETANRIERAKKDPTNVAEKGYLLAEPTMRIACDSTVPLPNGWTELDKEQEALLEKIKKEFKFFHWELEFPDVFNPQRAGFDGILGNPPWKAEKPDSKEFFSRVDPLYRSYGKEEALEHQTTLFKNYDDLESSWLEYNARFKSVSNWFKHRAHPFGDAKFRGEDGETHNMADYSRHWAKESDPFHKKWLRERKSRAGFADSLHPFQYQGTTDRNSYKLFVEMSHRLAIDGGHWGLIVPSGLYTDYGTQELRTLLLGKANWRWLFSFENTKGLFSDVDDRQKFGPMIVEKSGETKTINTSFMHQEAGDWEHADRHKLEYPIDRIRQFSPETLSILELRSKHDLKILTGLYEEGVLLGEESPDGWGANFNREFDMDTDSETFLPASEWLKRGFRPSKNGIWSHEEDERSLYPLYQGRFIDNFDFAQKGWVSGKGRSANWRKLSWEEKQIEPEFLGDREKILKDGSYIPELKICHMRMSSATNSRSMRSTLCRLFPAESNVVSITTKSKEELIALNAFINSFGFDYALRIRFGGNALGYHVTKPVPVPKVNSKTNLQILGTITLRLNCPDPLFAPEWLHYKELFKQGSWRSNWAISDRERKRLRATLDALVFILYGLTSSDVAYIMENCALPTDSIGSMELYRKGFYRVEKKLPPELRNTVLTQVAFQDLKWLIDKMDDRDQAIATFAGQKHLLDEQSASIPSHPHIDEDEGWMLPDELRLADYDLGHDDRAQKPQPVASELGPRFYDWQLEQDPETSWEECRAHAELIEKIVPTPDTEDSEQSSDDGDRQGELNVGS